MPTVRAFAVCCAVAAGLAGCSKTPEVVTLTEANAGEFASHPERFKGKVVRAEAGLSNLNDLPQGKTLQELRGGPVQFNGLYPNVPINLTATVPAGLDVPPATPGHELVVEFLCREGSRTSGNEATGISRLIR